ncbi:MAG: hypothetical protein ABEJ03_00520 [Candidatus Nanohaloarchaea archaeon]
MDRSEYGDPDLPREVPYSAAEILRDVGYREGPENRDEYEEETMSWRSGETYIIGGPSAGAWISCDQEDLITSEDSEW